MDAITYRILPGNIYLTSGWRVIAGLLEITYYSSCEDGPQGGEAIKEEKCRLRFKRL